MKGTYKRNHEGDYQATEHAVRGMIRDQNLEGNDGTILEYYTMDDIDKETLSGIGNSGKNLEENAGSGNWLEGRRFDAEVSESELRDWISNLQ